MACFNNALLITDSCFIIQEDPGPGYYKYIMIRSQLSSAPGRYAFNSSAGRFNKMSKKNIVSELNVIILILIKDVFWSMLGSFYKTVSMSILKILKNTC